MKMSKEQIQAIAAMLTDDPDVLINEDTVNEWWGKGPQLNPLQHKLAAITNLKDPQELTKLENEFRNFIKYRPNLQQQGEDAAIQAFITYKKTGRMPIRPELPQNMDQFGGRDFRTESKQR